MHLGLNVTKMWQYTGLVTSDDECSVLRDIQPDNQPLTLNCSPAKFGRYIYVRVEVYYFTTLYICEVSVFARKCEMFSLKFRHQCTKQELPCN